MKGKIVEAILEVVDSFNEELPESGRILRAPDAPLYGKNAPLDSIGLVNIVIRIEEIIEDRFNKRVTIADEKALSQKQSPFRSVDSMATYIEILLNDGKE